MCSCVCVCVCNYIYMYSCVYNYIYIYKLCIRVFSKSIIYIYSIIILHRCTSSHVCILVDYPHIYKHIYVPR